MDLYTGFMILVLQDCFVTSTLEIVTSEGNVSILASSESVPISKAVANYWMGHWALLLEVYEILEDIEGFTLYLKSNFKLADAQT